MILSTHEKWEKTSNTQNSVVITNPALQRKASLPRVLSTEMTVIDVSVTKVIMAADLEEAKFEDFNDKAKRLGAIGCKYDMAEYVVDAEHSSLQSSTMALMKLLRGNMHDHYKVSAVGGENVRLQEKIVQHMHKWVYVEEVYNELPNEVQVSVILRRTHDFVAMFRKYKEIGIVIKSSKDDLKRHKYEVAS